MATHNGSSALATGFKAMRLGSVIYFIPFFFVLEPALILSGTLWETIFATVKVGIGIILIAGSLQSYLFGVGHLDRGGFRGLVGRTLMALGGGLIALPASDLLGLTIGPLTLLGLGLLVSLLGVLLSFNSKLEVCKTLFGRLGMVTWILFHRSSSENQQHIPSNQI